MAMMLFWGYLILMGVTVSTFVFFIGRGLYYMKVNFPRTLRPRFRSKQKENDDPAPSVSLFVPCKGTSSDLTKNIGALLNQNYPCYEVFCITESAHDSAVPLLQSMASENPRLHHVVAGKATRCCQKNHNLLKGIDYAKQENMAGDIYVFADMDIHPAGEWLRNITLPLADATVFAVSGFRSLIPGSGRFSENLHAAFSALQALAMTRDNCAAMWGGSMALRRKAFEKHGVYGEWSRAIVDDMSLTRIIRKRRVKRVFSPDCLVNSRETYPELGRVLAWLVRQTQYAAIYLRPYTAFGLVLNTLLAFCMLMCPVALALSFLNVISGEAAVFHTALYLVTAGSMGLLGGFIKPEAFRFRWFLYAPLFLILGTSSAWIGFCSRRLMWADISYLYNGYGEVLTVKHPKP